MPNLSTSTFVPPAAVNVAAQTVTAPAAAGQSVGRPSLLASLVNQWREADQWFNSLPLGVFSIGAPLAVSSVVSKGLEQTASQISEVFCLTNELSWG